MFVCGSCQPKLPVIKFDDTMVAKKVEGVNVLMFGMKGIYCCAGKYDQFGKKLLPGQALLTSGKVWFRIRDLLAKYPELETDSSQVEEAKQERQIFKHGGL